MCRHHRGLMGKGRSADIKRKSRGSEHVKQMGRELRSAIAGFATPPIYEEPSNSWEIDEGALMAIASRVFDLAEGREPGHASRVAYVGRRIAEQMKLPADEIDDVYFACLLHDVARVIGGDGESGSEGSPLPVAEIVEGFGLRPSVARAVLEHKRYGWLAPKNGDAVADGGIIARVVAAAERLDSITAGGRSALLVRRRGPEIARSMASDGFGDGIAEALKDLTGEDPFWIGYYDNDLVSTLIVEHPGHRLDSGQASEIFGVLASLVDVRNGHAEGRARRVADLAEALARRMGEPDSRARLMGLAAMLQDVGTPGVPASYVRKPDLLTIDELADVQNHPVLARDILSELPGLGVIAWWVACHHERVDGRGYPVGLAGEEVPVEAQIIGIAETYEALISERPHRPAMTPADALEVLNGLAGARFLPELVRAFGSIIQKAALLG